MMRSSRLDVLFEVLRSPDVKPTLPMLTAAVKRGNEKAVECLLKNGADPQWFFSLNIKHCMKYLDLFTACGVNINDKFPDGDTLLHKVCWQIKPDYVAKLIKCGADVNAVSNAGTTPLDLTMHGSFQREPKQLQIFRLLLKCENIKLDGLFPNLVQSHRADLVTCLLSHGVVEGISAARAPILYTTLDMVGRTFAEAVRNDDLELMVECFAALKCFLPGWSEPASLVGWMKVVGDNPEIAEVVHNVLRDFLEQSEDPPPEFVQYALLYNARFEILEINSDSWAKSPIHLNHFSAENGLQAIQLAAAMALDPDASMKHVLTILEHAAQMTQNFPKSERDALLRAVTDLIANLRKSPVEKISDRALIIVDQFLTKFPFGALTRQDFE